MTNDPFKPGKPISARVLSWMFRAVDRFSRMQFESPLQYDKGANVVTLVQSEVITARITGGSNPYSWREIYSTPGGAWADLDRTGSTTIDPSYELNGATDVATNTRVIMKRSPATGEWLFDMSTAATAVTPGAAERCDCPEETYETTPCGICTDGTTTMPQYWIVSVLASEANPSASTPCDLDCADAVRDIEITKDVGTCTWSGGGCVQAELDVSADPVTITLMDRDDCILGIFELAASSFNCCGTNTGWTQTETNTESCLMTISLRPHECTCCVDTTCPPDGTVTCPQACCDSQCTLRATVDADCPANTCPDPPGECVELPTCTTDVAIDMDWIGGCTWYGEGTSPTRDATWARQGDGTWKLTAHVTVSGNECTYVFSLTDWNCDGTQSLTFVSADSTCSTNTVTGEIKTPPFI